MIKFFDSYKKISILHKKGSPYKIVLCTNDIPDFWLIDRVKCKISTGAIVEAVMILSKDFHNELKFWDEKGFHGMVRTKFKVQGVDISIKDIWEGDMVNHNCS